MVCAKCGEQLHKDPKRVAMMTSCNSCRTYNYIIGTRTFYIHTGEPHAKGTHEAVDRNAKQGTGEGPGT